MYANRIGYSDIDPYEIIRRISEKTIEVREMDAVLDENCKKAMRDSFVPGGFLGHTDNSLQEWIITSNPNNKIYRARLHKDGCYYSDYGKHRLSENPIKHYDYNF